MLVDFLPGNGQSLMKSVARAQSNLVRPLEINQLFEDFLSDILDITGAECGFVGEVLYASDTRKPFLKVNAVNHLYWDDNAQLFYHPPEETKLEFNAFNRLLEKVISKGEVIILNEKSNECEILDENKKTPHFESLLGIPICIGDELSGIVIVARRFGGYVDDLVNILTPLLNTFAEFVSDRREVKSTEALGEILNSVDNPILDLLKNHRTIVFISDSNGKILEANEYACLALGYTRHQLLNMSLFDINKSVERDKLESLWENLQSDERLSKNVNYVCKNGDILPTAVEIFVIQYKDRKCIVFTATNAIASERIEKQIKGIDERINDLISISPAVIYTCKAQNGFHATYVSGNVKTLLGYDASEFIEAPDFWKQRVHPDDMDSAFREFFLLLDKGSYLYEYRFRLNNGEYCWVRDEIKIVKSEDGNISEVVGCLTNVDQRRKLDEELHESSELSELLVSYMALTAGTSINEIIDSTLIFISERLSISESIVIVRDLHGRGYHRYSLGEELLSWVDGSDFFSDENSVVHQLKNSGRPLYRADIEASDFTFWDDDERKRAGYLSDLFLPLWCEDECIGALIVAKENVDGFSASLRDFMPLVNHGLNQALLNAMLIASLQSEQEKLESSILEREQALSNMGRFRRALDRPDDAILLIDPAEMRFLDFNTSAITSLGYSQEELREMGPHDINPDYSYEKFRVVFDKIIEQDLDHYSLNTLHMCKAGSTIPVEIHFSQFRDLDGDGDQVIIIAMARDISERHRAELALRASERRFRTLVDQSPLSTQILSPTGETRQVNKAWENLWGLKSDDLADHNMLKDDQLIEKGVMPYIEKAFSGLATEIPAIVYNSQESSVIRGGKPNNRWVRAFIYPVTDEQGAIQEVILMHEDISHRVEAEEALKKSEEKWRSMTSSSPDNIMLLDREFKVQFINSPLPGVSIEDVMGTGVFEYLPEKFIDMARECCQTVLETGNTASFETEYWIDGRNYFFDSHVGTVIIDGEVEGLVVSTRDISRRKLAEAKLSQSAAVVENTAEGVVITNEKREIVAVNTAFTEITGYTEKEVKGRDPRMLKSERHEEAFYTEMWEAINTTGRWQGEIWDRRKNGEIFPAWTTVSAIRNSEDILVNYVSVFSDISAIRRSQEKLDFLAYHDPLTNLPNRLLFNDRLEHAIQKAHRDCYQLAVLFIDLDRFKYINDTLGHLIGDKLIQQAASRLNDSVRDVDTLARLGGDEFVIVMEDIKSSKDAAILAEKVINRFRKNFEIDGHELHVTLSLGISLYPQDGDDSESLVKSADIALYQVKDEGRNGYNFYTPELASTAFERLSLETSLRHALGRDEMTLHYQPQYSLEYESVVGCEALIRWKHPDMGLVYPGRFIPIAEDSGLIIELGEWVLYTACAQMKAWLDMGCTMKHVAVNISALQLQRTDFVSVVESTLKHTGLPAECLELELTETVVMHKADWAIDMLEQLKKLGVRLSIDDFGTGYSSLAYLKRLPINKLKIDRSFVSDIPGDDNDTVITAAIIAMAKNLKLDVIAEGVETPEQQDFLQARGCNEIQGYLFGRPTDADSFSKNYID
ncbi:PAS domain S-box protein [Pseudomonadota bacterium]